MKIHFMKSALLFVLLFVSLGVAEAQRIRFTDTTNHWRVYRDGGGDCYYVVIFKYNYSGDTVMDGYTYQRLVGTNQVVHVSYYQGCFGDYPRTGTYFFREDTVAKKVWCRGGGPDTDKVVYNGAWGINDTVRYSSYEKFFVATIDSTLLNNQWHKVFHFKRPGVTNKYAFDIIEGIGSTVGPAIPFTRTNGLENGIALQCFWNNSNKPALSPVLNSLEGSPGYFSNSGPCNLGINTVNDGRMVAKIYPNPVTSISRLTLSKKISAGKLLIYNSNGQKAADILIMNATTIALPADISTPGLYFFCISDEIGNFYSGKFIIE